MPKESKIKFRDQGFRIYPHLFEVVCHYICKAFEAVDTSAFSSNLQEIYDDCNINRNGQSCFEPTILMDDSIISTIDKTDFINVLERAKTLIIQQGPELTINNLNELESQKPVDGSKRSWIYPIQTQSLVATIDIIIQLLNGTWQNNNKAVYFKGFPAPNDASIVL